MRNPCLSRLLYGLAAGLLLLGASWPVPAAEVELQEDYPERYEVREGDTLWDIAGQFLRDPWLWPQVWRGNPQIDNPHLIYPGDVITLRFENGEPVLSLQRRDSDLPVVTLSPRVRRQAFISPVPAISLESINAFLERNRIVAPDTLESAAYYLANREGTLMASSGDEIFARGAWTEGVSTYEIVRPGARFADPETEEEIGIEAEYVGAATLLTREQDRAILRVDAVASEVRQGDLLLPRAGSVIDSTYFPQPPDVPVSARILRIGAGLAYGGSHDTLILNRGERDALEVGHLLTVQKPQQQVPDPKAGETLTFPGEMFASVLIYRVFDNFSMGLVLGSSGPIRMNDRVVTP